MSLFGFYKAFIERAVALLETASCTLEFREDFSSLIVVFFVRFWLFAFVLVVFFLTVF
ncbi:MAG: Hypothetical protein BHV28_16800 [Candidatus Tokpelaia hoelldobleri]|uniref:Uncharacterized protein n=1 Tax=Candidatus Tokpelaia hoelldobleri TaxID=1902579 RepID=A0A1U9JT37_9HYPH|nr:MAG: Hypothetical protein BHV28_02980 [Candidatus Tokpelaia hoelldoblerii]AQS42350.1 MAG: Hypothetical protein BHV28_16800 [Candidatus Tokpelaia hoelldoblerii]